MHLRKLPLLDILLWSVGLGLVGANIVLLEQNRTLRRAAVSNATGNPNLEVGKHLGRYLAAASMDSALRPITFSLPDPKHTLIITFSPGCQYCKANLKTWLVVAKALRSKGDWRIFWVSRNPVESTKDYCEDFDIPLTETLADPTYRTYVVLGLNEVPNTIVVDEKGVVRKMWRGELDAAKWRQVFNDLGIAIDLPPS